MAVKIKTKDGLIDISNGVIATVVGSAATSNYGVVGMASKMLFEMASMGFLIVPIISAALLLSQKIIKLQLMFTLLLVTV